MHISEGCNHVEYCTLGVLVTLMMKFISVTVSLLCSQAVSVLKLSSLSWICIVMLCFIVYADKHLIAKSSFDICRQEQQNIHPENQEHVRAVRQQLQTEQVKTQAQL